MAIGGIVQSAKGELLSPDTDLVISFGAAPDIGNILIACITHNSANAITPDKTWTLYNYEISGNTRQDIYWREVESGDDEDYTFSTVVADDEKSGIIYEILGAVPYAPILTDASKSSDTLGLSIEFDPVDFELITEKTLLIAFGSQKEDKLLGSIYPAGYILDHQAISSACSTVSAHVFRSTPSTPSFQLNYPTYDRIGFYLAIDLESGYEAGDPTEDSSGESWEEESWEESDFESWEESDFESWEESSGEGEAYIRQTGKYQTSTNTSTVEFSIPPPVIGNILIAFITHHKNRSITPVDYSWNFVANYTRGDTRIEIYWRKATILDDGDYIFTVSSAASDHSGVIYEIHGANQTNPLVNYTVKLNSGNDPITFDDFPDYSIFTEPVLFLAIATEYYPRTIVSITQDYIADQSALSAYRCTLATHCISNMPVPPQIDISNGGSDTIGLWFAINLRDGFYVTLDSSANSGGLISKVIHEDVLDVLNPSALISKVTEDLVLVPTQAFGLISKVVEYLVLIPPKSPPDTSNGWAMYKNLHAVKDPSTGRIAFSGYYPVTAGDQPGTRPISFLESIDHGVNWYPVRSLFFDMTTGTEPTVGVGIEVVSTFEEDQLVFGTLKYYDGKLYAKTWNAYEGWRIRQYTTAGVEELAFDPEVSSGRMTHDSMAIDDDYIYVGGNGSVVYDIAYPHFRKFSRSTGALIATYQTNPTSEAPIAMYADNAGNVYIFGYHKGLRKFTNLGASVWANDCFALFGEAGVGESSGAYSIASDGTYIYIIDYNDGKILKFNCSDGVFVAETTNEVPVHSYSIAYNDGFLYVSKPYGVSIFDANTLELVAAPTFYNNLYDPRSVWDSITFDGTYFWTLGGDGLTVVQFSITS